VSLLRYLLKVFAFCASLLGPLSLKKGDNKNPRDAKSFIIETFSMPGNGDEDAENILLDNAD